MIRLIVLVIIAAAAFWCYNNLNFSKITDNMGASIKQEKTIKAVTEKRQLDYEQEEAAVGND